jgi:hypothetical protein
LLFSVEATHSRQPSKGGRKRGEEEEKEYMWHARPTIHMFCTFIAHTMSCKNHYHIQQGISKMTKNIWIPQIPGFSYEGLNPDYSLYPL